MNRLPERSILQKKKKNANNQMVIPEQIISLNYIFKHI